MNKNYWSIELLHPYSPSHEDVNTYKSNIKKGTTLLLGCTHKLLSLSDFQMDIDPWYEAPTVIVKDWVDNDKFYNNMIGDGVLNFTKDLTEKIIKMSETYSDVLIVRCFNKKLPNMKIANYFPTENDFVLKPSKTLKHQDYNFFIWNFKNESNGRS